MSETNPRSALVAMRTRGIDNATELLTFAAPDRIVAACQWWDKRKSGDPTVRIGLLAKKIREGGVDADDMGFVDAEKRQRALLARLHEVAERFPVGSVAEPHSRLQQRKEYYEDPCPGWLVVVEGGVWECTKVDEHGEPVEYGFTRGGRELEARCDRCAFEVAYPLRTLSDLPPSPSHSGLSEPKRQSVVSAAGVPRSFDSAGHVSRRLGVVAPADAEADGYRELEDELRSVAENNLAAGTETLPREPIEDEF